MTPTAHLGEREGDGVGGGEMEEREMGEKGEEGRGGKRREGGEKRRRERGREKNAR